MAEKMDGEAKKAAARSKTTPTTPGRKPATHTPVKKLPWLDGKSPQLLISTPPKGWISDSSLYETPSPGARQSSRQPPAAGPLRPTEKPTPPARRKSNIIPNVQSVVESSPSPVARHNLSQARRPSGTHKAFPPFQNPVSHRLSISHAPQKRLSIIHHPDHEPEEDDYGDIRPRVGSLAPVPDHLEFDSTSDSLLDRGDVVSSSSPAIISRVQKSPSQPIPTRSAFPHLGDRRISNAIEGLEDMVQEVVDLAEETTDLREAKEFYGIIEDARDAVQEALEDPLRHLMTTALPLEVSSGEIEHTVDSQRNPVPLDWAYSHHEEVSSSGDDGQSPSRLGTRSDLLLPPQPAQSTPRHHVDFVLRPQTREHSRGRSPKGASNGTVRARKHRHSRSPDKIRHRYRKHRSSSSSLSDGSFDEDEPPAKAYGTQLHVREQGHTFSHRRQHQRQPIARNWSTGKKRLTATFACINTALLGIIVGIYVSGILFDRLPRLT
jgi:hypothetical protein